MPEYESMNRARNLNYILLAAILIAAAAFSFFVRGGEDSLRLELHNEGYLTLRDSGGASVDIWYRDITELEYLAEPDYGEPAGGGTVDGIREGLWSSAALGEYTACASEKIRSCILVRAYGAAYAFNYESDAATKTLYEALREER